MGSWCLCACCPLTCAKRTPQYNKQHLTIFLSPPLVHPPGAPLSFSLFFYHYPAVCTQPPKRSFRDSAVGAKTRPWRAYHYTTGCPIRGNVHSTRLSNFFRIEWYLHILRTDASIAGFRSAHLHIRSNTLHLYTRTRIHVLCVHCCTPQTVVSLSYPWYS